MRPYRNLFTVLLLSIICQANQTASGQLGISFDLKKPKEYQERTLRSERSDQKKFNLPRRLIQNTVTHYNFFYNANLKLNEVLERAKESFKDDYSQLLPFYNYTLETTSLEKVSLDSIIDKSQTGIALHDLRNDWMDNLYLLWGAAYYLRKDFDSAYLMFQFINYAFADKEKGYAKTIGSTRDGNTAFSISTKEKNSLPRKVFSEPPSRNDAFIWQIRNFLAKDEYAEAASLIIALKSDPVFPRRLKAELEEVQALWFYKQNNRDSAALHLSNALDVATNKQERARWEYLIGQLHESGGNFKEAEKFYAKTIGHTTDPILDIYARLASIRVNKDGGDNYIDKNIAELLKMARRDKYADYRDIIYYMAAQMELQRNNVDGALALLKKSTEVPANDAVQRNRAFLQMAELTLAKKQYRFSYNYHDSLDLSDANFTDKQMMLSKRKEWLGKIAGNLETVEQEDSLQRIAAMSEVERKSFVKNRVRQLRRKEGLKDEPLTTGSLALSTDAPSLFSSTGSGKGEWYFYNTASKQKGNADFKTRWGNRPNSDNWRRSSAISLNVIAKNNAVAAAKANTGKAGANLPAEITFDALYANLPLTPEAKKTSDSTISNALFELGILYISETEDCSAAIESLERLRRLTPDFDKMNQVYFNLYYCYSKSGEAAKAADIKKLMTEKNPDDRFTKIVTTGKDPETNKPNEEATKTYESIYDLFIEGKFSDAIAQKKIADSIYSKHYWTPQLLYIEAVYYIKQREDSAAITVLNNIISEFPGTALSLRAGSLIDVLGRRKEIEEELSKLNIERPGEDSVTTGIATIVDKPKPAVDTANRRPAQIVNNKPPVDTSSKKTSIAVLAAVPFALDSNAAHYAVLMLNKVDPVFCNEARNAYFRYNRETYYNKQMEAELLEINGDYKFVLISPFKNAREALDYIGRAKPVTATEIIPWLKGGKYEYSIISESNLSLLKTSKNPDVYKQFINSKFPGKF
jgi:tetratricopeptide (TPR) repeat protein